MTTDVSPETFDVSSPHRVPQSILVIEDDPGILEALATRLRRHDFLVRTASRAAEGLAQARSDRPDLVLLDLRLPDADGLTVCQELADDPATCLIPIIVLSGQDRRDLVRCCRAAGCRYFMSKPYDPSALLILIRHALDESRLWSNCD